MISLISSEAGLQLVDFCLMSNTTTTVDLVEYNKLNITKLYSPHTVIETLYTKCKLIDLFQAY